MNRVHAMPLLAVAALLAGASTNTQTSPLTVMPGPLEERLARRIRQFSTPSGTGRSRNTNKYGSVAPTMATEAVAAHNAAVAEKRSARDKRRAEERRVRIRIAGAINSGAW